MMKNQSDLIALIVSVVVTLAALILCLVMKRDTIPLSPPTAVTTTPAALPAGDVIMADALPGGGGGGAGRMGGMGGMGGGKAGFMGGMGAMGGGGRGPGMGGAGKGPTAVGASSG